MKKTVSFNQAGIARLPNDKPVLYKITTNGGKSNYAGIAKRGRVQERIAEHLPGAKDAVPGSKVQIEQMSTIRLAGQKERKMIVMEKPKYNKKGI